MIKKGLPACLCLTLLLVMGSGTASMAVVNDSPADAPAETVTPIVTVTDKPVVTPTDIPVVTPTDTPVVTPTDTPIVTPSGAPVATLTDAPTVTPVPALTGAPTVTPVVTLIDTPADTLVDTPIDTPSGTPTVSPEPVHISSGASLPEPEAVKPSLEDVQPRLDAAECPESIKDFVRNYPEAISYAEGYMEYTKNPPIIDLTKEMEAGGIPLFIQWDPRWGYRTYGSDYIGIDGCGPTCMSMVVCGLTRTTDWNPFALALWAYNQGYYQYGVGTSWALMTQGASLLGLNAFPVEPTAEAVLTALQSGAPVVCSVSAGDFTQFGHFIILTGVDDTDLISLNDPNSPINSAKKWDLQTVLSQTVSTWAFSVN